VALATAISGIASSACSSKDQGPGIAGAQAASGAGGSLGLTGSSGTGGNGGAAFIGDPETCEQAAHSHSYIGCDFWPTVTPNNVWSIFDFAVVVANTSEKTVNVKVERSGKPIATATLAPRSLETIYLPWVVELKGADADPAAHAVPITESASVQAGAYHLATDFPVTVYQFNPLEYAPEGGPADKKWTDCPADASTKCFSYSNDASLLLPSTAMTGSYRVAGYPGWNKSKMGPFVAVTAVFDNTKIDVAWSATAALLKGSKLGALGPKAKASFTLNRGDVELFVGPDSADFSGSLLSSDKPIQILSGVPCTNIPQGTPACDHIEETVFPAETLGEHYVVAPPTGPNGDTPGHVVRLYGNFDGTTLKYSGSKPANAPTTLNDGEVVDLGQVTVPFEITGDKAFAVASFMLGGSIVDPKGSASGSRKGDPSQSLMVGVEQFRDSYVFLAPTDYPINYVDIIAPLGAAITLDDQKLTTTPAAIGASGHGVLRIKLGKGNKGAHTLKSTLPVGIQVSGYGDFTSYYYPGGLNLKYIAPPPIK
jgi:hypothetical protein